MPRVTQYIRDEDMDAWQAIENKSEWIHEHLSEGTRTKVGIVKNDADVKNLEVDKVRIGLGAGGKLAAKVASERLSRGICKIHGTPLTPQGKCLQKGCKYA